MPVIALHLLDADFRNANVCNPETLDKIQRNIERTGLCPALIVRPNPGYPERFILIDGHHRKIVLERLGWAETECQVWDVSDIEARIALTTLNQLRGEDNLHKRAELLSSLTQHFAIEELTLMIPESTAEIEDALSLLNLNWDAMQQALEQQIRAEEETLPVAFHFMVSAQEAQTIHQALVKVNQADKGSGFVSICRVFLERVS